MGAVVSALAPLLPAISDLLLRLLQQKPNCPAPMPTQVPGKTPEELRREAQAELGMDSVNCFNFGFAGESRTGKSSLINALRGVDDDSPDAAQVDEVECTKVITKYVHPENPCIVLWDIPGGGTTTHTAATYFMDKKLYAFDMIIIIGAAGFKELDIAIAKGAKEFNVPTVFVRSKSDIDIDNRSRRMKKPKQEVKYDVRQAIVTNIREQLPLELKDREIFVISSWLIGDTAGLMNRQDYALDEGELIRFVVETARRRRVK